MENLSGQNIKGYELRERIGAGGFGAVYRASQSTVGREVAVKIILPHFASHPDFIRRFETEAQLVARLEHLHIVPLYDYWRDPNGAYLVMRWLKGGSLRDALSNGPFAPEAAALLLDQVSSALAAAHRSDVIHRDLKPGNILLDEDGNAYLADFGIAKDVSATSNVTEPDAIVGSPDYLAPEQARAEQVTPRTDIYSLGVVLYEILTGQHPFPNLNMVERLYKHLNEPLPEIDTLPDDIRKDVNEVIQKATAKNPQNRYADTQELAAAFRAAIKSANSNPVETLTLREQDILRLIIDGRSNKEIAQQLVITLMTVKWYITQIYRKLGVRSRVQAIVRARELNLITKPGSPVDAAHNAFPTDQFQPDNPYKGLRAFQSADHQDFFGREKLVEKLLKRMGETSDGSHFLAVVGPSGSGKSSLVKAGLIPALWRGELPRSEKWFVAEMLPSAHPLDEMEVALTRVAANQAIHLREQLERDERGLIRATQLILPDDGSELLLVIDQFEEVFTLVENESERVHFLNILENAVSAPRSRVRVVITLRADFYDRPLHYPQFGELVRSRMETILPLSAEGLERAIARPAERVGVSFEPGLVAAIIGEINYQAGALPLLQYALTELFEQRQGRQLTHEAYQAIGRTTGALAKRAEEIYRDLSPEGQEAAQQMFLRLVTLGEGVEDTRRRVARDELLSITGISDQTEEILDLYAEYRLLSLDNDPGTRSPTVEVAHEAILREWQRLSNWITESREDIKMRQQLNRTAAEWQEKGKEVSYLASGQRLGQFESWSGSKRQALTALERAYLEASLSERRQQQAAETERQTRETRLERRSLTFLRGLIVALVLGLLGAIGLTGSATNQSNQAVAARLQAEDQARIATARELVGYANTNLNTDAELSTLLAIQAVNTTYEADGSVLPEANTVLHQAVQGLHTPVQIPSEKLGAEDSLYFGYSPDGKRIIYPKQFSIFSNGVGITGIADAFTGSPLYEVPGDMQSIRVSLNNTIVTLVGTKTGSELQLWDVSSDVAGKLLSSAPVPFRLVQMNWDDVSLDFRQYFASMVNNQNMILNLETGQEVVTPATQKIPAGNGKPAFSPDGKYLANLNPDGTLSIFDTASWEEAVHISPLGTNIAGSNVSFTFSLDGKNIATRNSNGTVTIWDVTSGAARYTVSPDAAPTWIALNADATRLAISSGNGQVSIWDMPLQRKILELGVSSNINGLALSSDGTQLATLHRTGIVQLWQLKSEAESLTLNNGDPITDQAAGIAVAYSPDGHRLVSASDNPNPTVWDAETGERIFTLNGHTAPVFGAAWSPDGTRIATASADNTAKIWDAETGKQLFTLSGHTGLVYGVGFSPNSQLVATTSDDGTVRIWNVANGQLKLTLAYPDNNVRDVAWSPNGQRIAATSRSNGTVRIWDAETGTQQIELLGDQNGKVHSIAFSPDGKKIVTGSYEQMNAFVWDAETGQKLMTLSGHTDWVGGVAYSPDGSQIATASTDGTAKLWDASTGQELLTLFVSSEGIRDIAFSPNGKHLATQNFDGTTRIYVLDIDELLALAQSRLTRWWTADECKKYLHTDTCPPSTAATTSS